MKVSADFVGRIMRVKGASQAVQNFPLPFKCFHAEMPKNISARKIFNEAVQSAKKHLAYYKN